jgi:LysR family transcriptional activator of mexEF-oprN operon
MKTKRSGFSSGWLARHSARASATSFDPATAARSFSLRISEYVSSYLLRRLCPFLRRKAPAIQIRAAHFTGGPRDSEIVGDEIQVTFASQTHEDTRFSRIRALSEAFVVVMARTNPAALQPLTLERYAALNHVKVAGTIGTNMIDDALERGNLKRRIVFQVPTWRDARYIVGTFDLVAAMPGRWAFEPGPLSQSDDPPSMAAAEFHTAPLPLDGIVFAIDLLWHLRYDSDPGHVWLRTAIVEQLSAPL